MIAPAQRIDDCARAARTALRSGRFAEAKTLYRQALKLNPDDPQALLDLSALERHDGDLIAARALLNRAIKLQPLAQANRPSSRSRPLVYHTRCLESALYCLVRDKQGAYRTTFKGGHFAIANLLDKSRVDLSVLHVRDGRVDGIETAPVPDLLINTIACADSARNSLMALEDFLRTHPRLPLINRPAAVLRTTRDGNYDRLNPIEGCRFARTRRVRLHGDARELEQQIFSESTNFPLIVRIAGRQTGREMYLCHNAAELVASLSAMKTGADAYVIDFADCRHGDGLYRKARAFFIGGRVYPVAYLASDEWQIHSRDRYRAMADSAVLQEQERRYLRDPAEVLGKVAWKALKRIGQVLDLDFAGVDFTTTRDGELFVFEANPAMRHNFEYADAFPYTRPHLERISRAFDAMVHRRIREGGR